MPIEPSRKPATQPAAVRPGDAAFVVHLTVAAELEERGRVEHLTSGRASRFESAGELLRFMRETLTSLSGEDGG